MSDVTRGRRSIHTFPQHAISATDDNNQQEFQAVCLFDPRPGHFPENFGSISLSQAFDLLRRLTKTRGENWESHS